MILARPLRSRDVTRHQRRQRRGVDVRELARLGHELAVAVDEEHRLGVGVMHQTLGHRDELLVILFE